MNNFKTIYDILSPSERRHAIGLLGLMFVGMVVETLGIGLVVPLMTVFMQDDVGKTYPALLPWLARLGNPTHNQLVIGGMIGLVSLYFFKSLYLGYLVWEQSKFNNRVLVHLSRRLFTLYLRQPYAFHLQRNSSELIRNIVNEVGYFLSTGLGSMMVLVTESMVLLGIGILLFCMEPVGASSLVITVGITGSGFQWLTRKRVARWGLTRQTHDGLRIRQVQQGLGGVKDVVLLGREEDFLNQYDIHNSAQARAGLNLTVLQAMPRLSLEVMAIAGLASLVVTMTLQGRPMSSIIPALALFGAAAFRLLPSVGKVLASVQSARFGDSVLEMLKSELALELPEVPQARASLPMTRSIELRDISFTYAAATSPALTHLSLSINRGETVGFIGPSGSGKSSLVDLILGLLYPDSGDILVDGESIHGNLRGWQDQIGYVPQTIFLTDDTLRRNIAFGLNESQIDDTAVARTLKAAQLDEFVKTLPEGLETIVGERGIRLSGGQRQRIGIARALYHDPAVLVLDEATSALDVPTETEVMESINALHGNKTILIVAHRLSTVENCDRIYRLESGRVVAEGPPHQMIPMKQPA
ncbi:MAG: ABC transporter ATP-binding protein [Verrucomicrobiota bacterium]